MSRSKRKNLKHKQSNTNAEGSGNLARAWKEQWRQQLDIVQGAGSAYANAKQVAMQLEEMLMKLQVLLLPHGGTRATQLNRRDCGDVATKPEPTEA